MIRFLSGIKAIKLTIRVIKGMVRLIKPTARAITAGVAASLGSAQVNHIKRLRRCG